MKKLFFIFCLLPMVLLGQSSIEVKFVEGYEKVNSIKELLKKFPDRTVYIDLWATWCGPCIEEFKHKDGLNAFVQKNDIDVLYISMDQDKDEEKWKVFVEENKLKGYHLRANKYLTEDILHQFSQMRNGRKSFGIPYYIIAKNDEIAVKNAPRPSAKEELYEELKKHL